MLRPRLFRLFNTPFLLTSVFFCFLLGCSSDTVKPPSVTSVQDNAKRPPLKIWLVDAPELEKELSIRWQAASDQRLAIQSLSVNEVLAESHFNADVLIYPGTLMGDLIQREAIGRLPSQISTVKKSSEEGELSSSEKTTQDSSDEWPVRWKNITNYAGQRFSLPLGATQFVALSNHLPESSSRWLPTNNGTNPIALNQWAKFADAMQESMASSASDRASIAEKKLMNLSASEKDCLVDRFLWLVSCSSSRRNGLFDLDNMKAHLHEPDFVTAAQILGQLVRLFPETMLSDPTLAWAEVVNSRENVPSFTIGLPGSNAIESPNQTDSLTVYPWSWNTNQGLMVSVGKNTRQTAVSSQLVVWLAEQEQREALRHESYRIELLPGQSDQNIARKDYREFQRANTRDLRAEGAELSLRMANANHYRRILAAGLVEAIQKPEQISAAMLQVSEQWNELTKSFGMDKQRASLEKSLGLRK